MRICAVITVLIAGLAMAGCKTLPGTAYDPHTRITTSTSSLYREYDFDSSAAYIAQVIRQLKGGAPQYIIRIGRVGIDTQKYDGAYSYGTELQLRRVYTKKNGCDEDGCTYSETLDVALSEAQFNDARLNGLSFSIYGPISSKNFNIPAKVFQEIN